MDESTDGRPVVRCFVAQVRPDGRVRGDVGIASLGMAYLKMCEGYAILGPDPEDEIALAAWERAHTPFNHPRVR